MWHLTHHQLVGICIVVSVVSMWVAAFIVVKWKNHSIRCDYKRLIEPNLRPVDARRSTDKAALNVRRRKLGLVQDELGHWHIPDELLERIATGRIEQSWLDEFVATGGRL